MKQKVSNIFKQLHCHEYVAIMDFFYERHYTDSDVFMVDDVVLADILDFRADIMTFFHGRFSN